MAVKTLTPMDGSKLLLDTSVVIGILRGSPRVKTAIDGAEQVAISSIVIGELYYGAFNSSAPEKHLRQLNDLLKVFELIDVDHRVAESYGVIKGELRRAGKPIPENDIWIAAAAITHGFQLVTSDAHFNHIPNLELVNP